MANVTVDRDGDIAWVTIDNPPVNATSTAVRAGLRDAVAEVRGARLAVLQCAGGTFVAGGDMTEFDRSAEEPHLPDVVNAIEDSETPFLALLHGNVLGGGFEIAMGCAFRVAAPGTRFGLPEVNVGLIPGAGGTQRAPRLMGWQAAIDMACSGQMFNAVDMLTLGAIDAISDDLTAYAKTLDLPRPTPVSKRIVEPMTAAEAETARDAIARKAKGQQSALLNFDALQWATLPFSDGQPKERAMHLELRQSDESRALRHIFFAERAVSRPAVIKDGTAHDLKTIAVVGGGLMGAGIAAACLNAGLSVRLIEREADAAAAARSRVTNILEGTLKRGKINETKHKAQLAAFSDHASYNAAAQADLAIEAVFEDVGVKQQVFTALAGVMRPDAILATNTSYLDPRDIFAGIKNPERCLGLHFFSPAHIMKLVEVVTLPGTSADTLASGFALSRQMRKVGVLSGICDGFIGNRMLAAYRRAAEYMLADGALPQDIDKAMRDFGYAMGPFEAQDMSGLQIALANRRRQDAARDPAERYVEISDRLCDLGRFGQRSGKGWYRYKENDRRPHPDPEVTALIEAYSTEKGLIRKPLQTNNIQTRLLTALANEGARIVEEGIAEDDCAVDIVKVMGYGFPRWRGGPMFAANTLGEDNIRDALTALEAASPGSWIRAKRYT